MEPCFSCRGSRRNDHDDSIDCARCAGSGVEPSRTVDLDREARRIELLGEFRRMRPKRIVPPRKVPDTPTKEEAVPRAASVPPPPSKR